MDGLTCVIILNTLRNYEGLLLYNLFFFYCKRNIFFEKHLNNREDQKISKKKFKKIPF